MTMIETCIRNLTRSFLACSHLNDKQPSAEERADTEQAVRTLLAMIYAAKNHLRAEWGTGTIPFLLDKSDIDRDRHRRESTSVHRPEYEDLLPSRIRGYEDQGLGLLLQLSIKIESYIKRAHDRGWFHSPQASQMTVQLNQLVAAYGSMETIHLTPIPVAYLIHMRQVLALFGGVLPFALVEEMGWYAVVLVSLVMFTLYGKLVIFHNNTWFTQTLTCARNRRYWRAGMSKSSLLTLEESSFQEMSLHSCGIDTDSVILQLEDPFGYDRADIKVDAIVEDLRVRSIFPGPTILACAVAIPPAQLPTSRTELIDHTTGGDKRIDRRVEKGLGYVRALDIPDATIMELADRLTQDIGGFDQFQSLSSRTKAFRPFADTTRLFAYTAPRLQGLANSYQVLLLVRHASYVCRRL